MPRAAGTRTVLVSRSSGDTILQLIDVSPNQTWRKKLQGLIAQSFIYFAMISVFTIRSAGTTLRKILKEYCHCTASTQRTTNPLTSMTFPRRDHTAHRSYFSALQI